MKKTFNLVEKVLAHAITAIFFFRPGQAFKKFFLLEKKRTGVSIWKIVTN